MVEWETGPSKRRLKRSVHRSRYFYHSQRKYKKARDRIKKGLRAYCDYQLCKVRQKFGHLGWVVREPVNANPGLKVNPVSRFSCLKTFLTTYVLCSLRLFKQYQQKTSPKNYQTQM